jgi:hypothetical protein
MLLKSEKTETPDLMPLEYQLHALVMIKTPQLWSRKPAVGKHLCSLNSDEAVCLSVLPGLE